MIKKSAKYVTNIGHIWVTFPVLAIFIILIGCSFLLWLWYNYPFYTIIIAMILSLVAMFFVRNLALKMWLKWAYNSVDDLHEFKRIAIRQGYIFNGKYNSNEVLIPDTDAVLKIIEQELLIIDERFASQDDPIVPAESIFVIRDTFRIIASLFICLVILTGFALVYFLQLDYNASKPIIYSLLPVIIIVLLVMIARKSKETEIIKMDSDFIYLDDRRYKWEDIDKVVVGKSMPTTISPHRYIANLMLVLTNKETIYKVIDGIKCSFSELDRIITIYRYRNKQKQNKPTVAIIHSNLQNDDNVS